MDMVCILPAPPQASRTPASVLPGILLPPFTPRYSSVLPLEPRAWLCAGADRPHMRPSRAAVMARLLDPAAGSTVLDPCGGIGLLAIELASLVEVHAISLDCDAVGQVWRKYGASTAQVRRKYGASMAQVLSLASATRMSSVLHTW